MSWESWLKTSFNETQNMKQSSLALKDIIYILVHYGDSILVFFLKTVNTKIF